MLTAGQTDLFKPTDKIQPDIDYVDDFLDHPDGWFEFFQKNIQWNEQFQSRKTAMFGVSYGYKGNRYRYRPLPKFLIPIAKRIEAQFGYLPNSCLINSYPSGDHYISYHTDRDMEMNEHTGVSIVSFGAVREMGFRRLNDPGIQCFYALQPGSALYMDDAVQRDWQHGIPKQSGKGHRISLSFRSLIVR